MKCQFCNKKLKESWQKAYCSRECSNKANAKRLSRSRKGAGNPMFGKRPWNYKGKHLSSDGYWIITVRDVKGYKGFRKVRLHRYIIEQVLGRRLTIDEDIHHINGIKTDNRLENLEIINHGEHTKLHSHLKKWKEKQERMPR